MVDKKIDKEFGHLGHEVSQEVKPVGEAVVGAGAYDALKGAANTVAKAVTTTATNPAVDAGLEEGAEEAGTVAAENPELLA